MLKLTACAESGSEHPLAEAIVNHGKNLDLDEVSPTEFTALSGRGLLAFAYNVIGIPVAAGVLFIFKWADLKPNAWGGLPWHCLLYLLCECLEVTLV